MVDMKDAVIVSAARTPTGKFQGLLKDFKAPDLGAIAIKEAVCRAKVDAAAVNEVIMGCVVQAGIGQAPARQAALKAGLPPEVSALTVNMVCGSGLRAVALASQAVQLGDSEIVVAGGMESMSNIPYALPTARNGMRMGNQTAKNHTTLHWSHLTQTPAPSAGPPDRARQVTPRQSSPPLPASDKSLS